MELTSRNNRQDVAESMQILKSRSDDNNYNKRKSYATHSYLLRSLVVVAIVFVALANGPTVVNAKPKIAASKAIIRTTTKWIPTLHSKSSSVAPKSTSNHNHHGEELMSGPTAIANVLADLCPHGMLPIGMSLVFEALCNNLLSFVHFLT